MIDDIIFFIIYLAAIFAIAKFANPARVSRAFMIAVGLWLTPFISLAVLLLLPQPPKTYPFLVSKQTDQLSIIAVVLFIVLSVAFFVMGYLKALI